MPARLSEDWTLDQLMAVPGIGAQVVAALPIPDRVRLRHLSPAYRSLVDESLLLLTELYGEDLGEGDCRPGTGGLTWLMDKCPNLVTLSTTPRSDLRKPWQRGDAWSPTWPWARVDRKIRDLPRLDAIGCRYPAIKSLNVAGSLNVSNSSLMDLAWHCPDLESLDVSRCEVSGLGVRAVVKSCHKLRRLAAVRCKSLDNDVLACLAQHCPQLEELYVGTTCVDDAGLSALSHGCDRLRVLMAAGTSVTDAGIRHVAERCLSLEEVGLRACQGVTDASVESLAACCPLLRHLDIAVCRQVTDASLVALASKCAGIRHLDVSATAVTDAGIDAVASGCPQLEYLELGQWSLTGVAVSGVAVSDASVMLLAKGCPCLRHLSVAGCVSVTDVSISQVAEGCPRLRELIVRGTGISDASLRAIAARCHQLRYLDLLGCRVEGGALAALAAGCPLLEHLDVAGAGPQAITEESMDAIGHHCTRLRVFIAGRPVNNVEEAGLDRDDVREEVVGRLIKERGAELQVIGLSGVNVTNMTVELIADRCPKLQELTLKMCRGVRNKGMYAVVARCRELRLLDLDGCLGVTRASFRGLDRDKCWVYWGDEYTPLDPLGTGTGWAISDIR
eukprot:jgi/Mesvir1/12579/Mv10328-RA.1